MYWIFKPKKLFSILIVFLLLIQTLSNGVFALNLRAGRVYQQRWSTISIQSAMSWFVWYTSQGFLTSLSDLVWDDMTLQWLDWFNALMRNDSVTTWALQWISRSLIPPRRRRQEMSRLSTERKALVAMSQVVNQWKMTAAALRTIKDMFDDDLISPVWLTRLASLYRQNNIHYISIGENDSEDGEWESEDGLIWSEDNWSIVWDNSDGINRKYASTRFPGCEENDIILDGKVWAACNADYPWEDDGVSHLDTYNNNWINARDQHWWKYGALYPLELVSCPDWYTLMDLYEIQKKDLTFFQTVKIPLWWYILAWGYYDDNGDYTRGIRFKQQWVVGSYIVKKTDSERSFMIRGDWISRHMEGNLGIYYRWSLRCERIALPTKSELQEDVSESEYSEEASTKDEYINSKISEINQCHIDLYNSQLEEINTTISSFQESVTSAHNSDDDIKAQKYIKAISILERIKREIVRKYKSLFGIE